MYVDFVDVLLFESDSFDVFDVVCVVLVDIGIVVFDELVVFVLFVGVVLVEVDCDVFDEGWVMFGDFVCGMSVLIDLFVFYMWCMYVVLLFMCEGEIVFVCEIEMGCY